MVKIIKSGASPIEILQIDMRNANTNEGARVDHTTRLAAISRGKHAVKHPEKRYHALMKEAEGGRPSRPFEFLPTVVDYQHIRELSGTSHRFHNILRYGYVGENEDKVYTNMRALINGGIPYEEIPYNEVNEDFVAFRIVAPMFVWAQIVTHTQLSTESQSDRVTGTAKYWLPSDIEERTGVDHESFKNQMLLYRSQKDTQRFLKDNGYPMEIYSRAPYYFKMKEFVITGYLNDDNAWPHFLRERNAYMNEGVKNWTQDITQSVAFGIRELLEASHPEHMGKILEEINERKETK